ncbi:hypothetical protein ABT263_19155 [Kitasatospora sp. NPDC001603]|uniref:hypothetical protein n=1 Tax=Kitasatospora sp. NPDC001603 TaxID=3154388 RepID=UPI00331C0C7A
MAEKDSDAEGRSDQEDGDGDRLNQPDRPKGPYRPGFEDTFWLVLLGLIVAVLFLVGLLSSLGGDAGPANQDWNSGWH